MKYRKLDAAKDYMFGRSLYDFYRDEPEAVAQAVITRLALKTGAWFLDITEGTDWEGQILGRSRENTRDVEIRSRIAGTQGVNELLGYNSRLDHTTRELRVDATIDTIYGVAQISVGG